MVSEGEGVPGRVFEVEGGERPGIVRVEFELHGLALWGEDEE